MDIQKIVIGQKPTYIKFGENIDFYTLFKKIEQAFETCFIFESLGEEGKFSRYSVLGFSPDSIIRGKGNTLYIDDKEYKVQNPYLSLKNIMPQQTIARNYAGGLIGYISYDAASYFEPTLNLKKHSLFDDFVFGVYTDGLIFDKLTNELFYFYHHTDRSKLLKRIAQTRIKKQTFKATHFKNELTKKEHEEKVEYVKKEIRSGNTFQCQVGFKSEFEVSGNTLAIYEKLRKVNPSPFMYYVKSKKVKIIGASPELLFGLRNGEMVTRPLAGTIKRGKNKKEDQRLSLILLSDPKEIAEHNMLVDLHRNDMGRVSQFGTVKVRDLMSVKKFSHVQHISSEIVGILKQTEDMFSGLACHFPAGTLTGAPKIESMKIIDRIEKKARGPYGGAVGHFGFNGDSTFAIAIRSVFVNEAYAYTQTSSGVVYDSIAQKEYDEILQKLAAIKEIIKS